MTAAHRLAWFTAGVAATVASLAALAVHWGRAAARTEGYGTHMRSIGGRITGPGTRGSSAPVMLSPGGPVCGFDDRPLRRMPEPACHVPGCVLHETPERPEGKT